MSGRINGVRLARWRALAVAMACVGIWLGTAALAQPYQAFPVDEATRDPALAALRDQLLDAVRRRDTSAVVALAAPDIHLSFGGDHGRATLGRWLRGQPNNPWTGPTYWAELEHALSMGSAGYSYSGGDDDWHFCAPYTFYAEYPVEIDPFMAIMFIRADAPLYAEPDEGSAVVATLEYAIAEVIEQATEYDPEQPSAPYWVRVRTADGAHEGFAVSTDFHSAVGYRACFSRDAISGEWVWDAFIAGD